MAHDDEAKATIQFLLADLNSLKSEISRRSNLQRIALATFLAVLAWEFSAVLSQDFHLWPLIGLWASAWLTVVFYTREGFEIMRLAGLIRDRIGPQLSNATGKPLRDLIPSEVEAGHPIIDQITSRMDNVFQYAIFLGAPIAISLAQINVSFEHRSSWVQDYGFLLWFVAIVGALFTLRLLIKRRLP